ncbi:MAG: BamA/TamA family outer membrane protein [Bacteroidia bacterium]
MKQITVIASATKQSLLMMRLPRLRLAMTLIIYNLAFILFNSSSAKAQTENVPKDSTTKFGNSSGVEDIIEKDLIEVTRKVLTFFIPHRLKHPIVATDSTIKDSTMVFFAFLPAVGYAMQTGVTGIVAINISFFTSKKNKDTRLSSFTINPAASLQNQVMVPIQSNIWINKNKINLLGDWRYYFYPTETFGLGGQTSINNDNTVSYSFVRVYEEASKRILPNFYAGLGYGLDWHFNIHQIEQEGLGTDFLSYNRRYGSKKRRTVSSGPVLNLTYDSRDNTNNPHKGNYANMIFHSNLTAFGSNRNWQSLQIDLRKFIPLKSNGRHVLALWSYNWFTFGGKAPYFDLPSTGWDTYSNTGRGYIQGRLRGTNFIYAETEYRFTITKNGLFGGVVFANAQSVSNYTSTKPNDFFSSQFTTILPAAGFGIRLKINKVSKVNFALDYGWGVGGSHGFFFNLSEVF